METCIKVLNYDVASPPGKFFSVESGLETIGVTHSSCLRKKAI